MAEPTTKPNLYQRLIMVIDMMGALEKEGRATYGNNYAYHRIDDVVNALRGPCASVGIVMLPCVTEAKTEPYDYLQIGRDGKQYPKRDYVSTVHLNLTLVNPDAPDERVTLCAYGDGIDSGDKAAGKATSYALKNILLALFQLRGQPDNEEADHDHANPAAAKPASGNGGTLPPPADWRDVVHHTRTPKNKATGKREKQPLPLGKLPIEELEWWIANFQANPGNTLDERLRQALDMAREERKAKKPDAQPGSADNPM